MVVIHQVVRIILLPLGMELMPRKNSISYSFENTPSKETERAQKKRIDYYPFGLQHQKANAQAGSSNLGQNWKYLGQEHQNDLGLNWITFRHRNFNPEIGRFFGVDPVSEEYFSISTYQFAHNNPVWKIEIEGLEGASINVPDRINEEKVKKFQFFNPRTKPVGKIFTASGSLRGKAGPSLNLSVSAGNSKAGISASIVEGKGTVTSNTELKGQVNVLNVKTGFEVKGVGKSETSLAVGQLKGSITKEGAKGEVSLGAVSANATINGVTVGESGTIVSSNPEVNGKMSSSVKGGAGALNANFNGNTVGIGVGVGPASVSVSANIDQAKNAVSNFFNKLADLIINGEPK